MLDLSVVTSQWRVIIICLFVCIAAFQFGYDSTYFGGDFPPLSFLLRNMEFPVRINTGEQQAFS